MICTFLKKNNIPFVAIEASSERVRTSIQSGQLVFGDCTQLKTLEQMGIKDARLIILTFKSLEVARSSVQNIRQKYPDVPILARCYDHKHVNELVLLGVNKAMPEMLETSLLLAAEVLAMVDIQPQDIAEQIQAERERYHRNTS